MVLRRARPSRHPRLPRPPHAPRPRTSAPSRALSPRCDRSTAGSISAERVEANPARAVSHTQAGQVLPAYLDRAQIDLLFQSAELHAQEGRFEDVRNLAILELFYSTGMRLSELAGINKADIDLVAAGGEGARQGAQGTHRPRGRSRAARRCATTSASVTISPTASASAPTATPTSSPAPAAASPRGDPAMVSKFLKADR